MTTHEGSSPKPPDNPPPGVVVIVPGKEGNDAIAPALEKLLPSAAEEPGKPSPLEGTPHDVAVRGVGSSVSGEPDHESSASKYRQPIPAHSSTIGPDVTTTTGGATEAFPAGRAKAPSEQSNRLSEEHYSALLALGRRAMAAPNSEIILQDAAQLLAQSHSADFRIVAQLTAGGREIVETLYPSCDCELELPQSRTFLANDSRASAAGYALAVAMPLLITDLPRERRFTDPLLMENHLRALLLIPLRMYDRAFGVVGIAAKAPRPWDNLTLAFTEALGHLVTATVARLRADQQLVQLRRSNDLLRESLDWLIYELDTGGAVLRANNKCREVTGLLPEEIRGRLFAHLLFDKAGSEACSRSWAELLRVRTPQRLTMELIAKNGKRHLVAWTFVLVDAQATEGPAGIVLGKLVNSPKTATSAGQAAGSSTAHAAESTPGLLEGLSSNTGVLPRDRRRRPRRAYPYMQSVAPVIDGRFPHKEDFEEVRCHDISEGGISFLYPTPYPSDMLVIALGAGQSVAHFMAQVVHVTRLTKNGRKQYLIGCQYLGRIKHPL